MAHQVIQESMSSDKWASGFSDSGLEDSMCSGQTGTSSPSDSPNFSPKERLPFDLYPDIVWDSSVLDRTVLARSNSCPSTFNQPRVFGPVGGPGVKTTDGSTQTLERESFAEVSPRKKLDKRASSFSNVRSEQSRDLRDYYSSNAEDYKADTACSLWFPGSVHESVRPKFEYWAPQKGLSVSPNSAFSKPQSTRHFLPLSKPQTDQEQSRSVNVSYSLNSVYQEQGGFLRPDLTEWELWNESEVIDILKRAESQKVDSVPQNQSPNSTVLNVEKSPVSFMQSVMDESSSDSVNTPSDDSDSLCELELDWDFRSSSPDFQEVKLQTKLRKNQDLMKELIQEMHSQTPSDCLSRSNSTASVDSLKPQVPLQEPSQLSRVQPGQAQPQENLLVSQDSQVSEQHSKLRPTEKDEVDFSLEDSDVSSSVSSWIDSDPSSDDGAAAEVPPTAPKGAKGIIQHKPATKKIIPRPDWAAIKAQQWKANSSQRTRHMKRPSIKSRFSRQPKIVSEGPVLVLQKSMGTYVVNASCEDDDDSDSTSESDSDRERRKASPRKNPGRLPSYPYCSSSDSELSTIQEVSEEDQPFSFESSPPKSAIFQVQNIVIPTIAVAAEGQQSSTEDDADDEDENPEFLVPTSEPKIGWPSTEQKQNTNSGQTSEMESPETTLPDCVKGLVIEKPKITKSFKLSYIN